MSDYLFDASDFNINSYESLNIDAQFDKICVDEIHNPNWNSCDDILQNAQSNQITKKNDEKFASHCDTLCRNNRSKYAIRRTLATTSINDIDDFEDAVVSKKPLISRSMSDFNEKKRQPSLKKIRKIKSPMYIKTSQDDTSVAIDKSNSQSVAITQVTEASPKQLSFNDFGDNSLIVQDYVDGLLKKNRVNHCDCLRPSVDDVGLKFMIAHFDRLRIVTKALTKDSMQVISQINSQQNSTNCNDAPQWITTIQNIFKNKKKNKRTLIEREQLMNGQGTYSTGEWPEYKKVANIGNRPTISKKKKPIIKFAIRGKLLGNVFDVHGFEVSRIGTEYTIRDSFLYAFMAGCSIDELQVINALIITKHNMYLSREGIGTFFVVDLTSNPIDNRNNLCIQYCVSELMAEFVNEVKPQLNKGINIVVLRVKPIGGSLCKFKSTMILGKYRSDNRITYVSPLMFDNSVFTLVKDTFMNEKINVEHTPTIDGITIKNLSKWVNYSEFFNN